MLSARDCFGSQTHAVAQRQEHKSLSAQGLKQAHLSYKPRQRLSPNPIFTRRSLVPASRRGWPHKTECKPEPTNQQHHERQNDTEDKSLNHADRLIAPVAVFTTIPKALRPGGIHGAGCAPAGDSAVIS